MRFSRRLLLAAAAIGLPLLAAPGRAAPPPEAVGRLRRLARPAPSARALDLAYLARRPDEAGPARLAALVLAALGLGEADLAAFDDRSLAALLADRIRADFAAGRMESAGGWMLARTEARLLALAV